MTSTTAPHVQRVYVLVYSVAILSLQEEHKMTKFSRMWNNTKKFIDQAWGPKVEMLTELDFFCSCKMRRSLSPQTTELKTHEVNRTHLANTTIKTASLREHLYKPAHLDNKFVWFSSSGTRAEMKRGESSMLYTLALF